MALLALAVAACSGATSSPRPSPSLIDLDFTPLPTVSRSPSSPSPSAIASAVTRPAGWDPTFCAMFAETRIAQELVVDIERALDEPAPRDALGLARELRRVAQNATTLIDEIPTWDEADEVLLQIATLLDLGARAAAEYDAYLSDDSRAALRRARSLSRDNADGVRGTNAALEDLAAVGVECTDGPLVLESP